MVESTVQITIKLGSIDDIPLVVMGGECDAFSAPFTHGAVSGLIDQGFRGIIIDISDLKYLDGSGFSALDDCCKKIKAVNGQLLLVNPGPNVEEIYEILKDNESCVVMDSVEEAFARIKDRQL